jgi:hypothetical protein
MDRKSGSRGLAVLSLAAGLIIVSTGGRPAMADGPDWSQLQLNAAAQPPAEASLSAPPDAVTFFNFLDAWRATAAQARANQPAWSSPLVTTTGMLEQRLRFDIESQQAGNRSATTNLDGGRGLDLIVSPSNEIQIALPPYVLREAMLIKNSFSGFGDWPFLRVKQQLAASPASGDNYFATVWLQVQAPTGIPQLTTATWEYLPTFAFGKGWGDFDIQATVGGVLPASHVATIGDQVQTNVAFQYHIMKLWPELEVNWTYWANGARGGLNQVFLTPGLVIGRFEVANGLFFTTGVGVQVAVAPSYRPIPQTPIYNNALIITSRLNF